MNTTGSLVVYLIIGLIGGTLGHLSKVPVGTLLGAVLAVVAFKYFTGVHWPTPRIYGFFCQVVIGVLIGMTYKPNMFETLGPLLVPMVLSTVVLILCGTAISVYLWNWCGLDLATAYIASSPGGMSALVPMAFDTKIDPALIATFHIIRIFLVVLTAPLVFKIIMWLGKDRLNF